MTITKASVVVVIALVALVAVVSGVRLGYKGALNEGLKWHKMRHGLPEIDNPVPNQWFTQAVDHFDIENTDTYQQRYLVNDTYWTTGGPIFLLLGGEGPIEPDHVQGHFILNQYAEKFGALIIAVEHRFYGESIPYGNLSTQNLNYLTTQQALADYATFRQYITEEYDAQDSVWISFGGSYSGSLSAWIRLKYPHLFAGSVATSAPVNAQEDFSEYFEVVQQSVGPACAERIANATAIVTAYLGTEEGREFLQAKFNTCDPIITDDDVATFMNSLSGGISEIVQYNNDNNLYTGGYNIPKMCNVLLQGSGDNATLDAYVQFNEWWNQFTEQYCTPASYKSYIAQLQEVDPNGDNAAARSWTWQTCIEYGYFQTAETSNQPFSEYINLDWYTQQCSDIFGPQFDDPNTEWINTDYGATDLQATNVVLPNGSIDPWHILGVLTSPNPTEATVLFMDGTAHCADLYPPTPNDLPTLTATREIEQSLISSWLIEAKK